MSIRFDGRVAIVTGAGNGLGRSHALALAARGASVIVNDLGGTRDGTGSSASAAESVVEEIKAAGGKAMANGANVTKDEEVYGMVQQALDAYGRVDILINNAGVLRDKSFSKMEMSDFRFVLDVHLVGSALCSKAVWSVMRDQGYGRILMTSSSSGLYGNFGQSNYGAAKMGVVGLMNTLHIEGSKYDIRVNTLAPTAFTRMTEDLGLPPEAADLMTPESVSAGAVFLVSQEAPSRTILAAGAGGYARTLIYETKGIHLKPEDQTPENVAANFDAISNPAGQEPFEQGAQQTIKFLTKAHEAK